MSDRLNLVCPTQYDWAFNRLKLNQSYSALMLRKRDDAKIEVNEAAIKEEYISRKGLLVSEQKKLMLQKRPRNTSNVDNR